MQFFVPRFLQPAYEHNYISNSENRTKLVARQQPALSNAEQFVQTSSFKHAPPAHRRAKRFGLSELSTASTLGLYS